VIPLDCVRYFWIGLTSLVVLAGISVPFLWNRGASSGETPTAVPETTVVDAGEMYYVMLSAIEVAPQKDDDGAKWDIDGSPPDLYFEIHWQGHKVFSSSTKKDTLVARWTNITLGVGDVLSSGVSLDDSIKAARITARKGDEIEFRVYDDDLAGDDLVGRFKVPAERLRVGDQEWTDPAGRIVSAHGRVLRSGGDVKFGDVVR